MIKQCMLFPFLSKMIPYTCSVHSIISVKLVITEKLTLNCNIGSILHTDLFIKMIILNFFHGFDL